MSARASSFVKLATAALALVGAVTLAHAQGAAGAKKEAPAEFATSAPNAILIEASTGSVLFEKNADELVPPASLAKLMTAALVFKEIRDGKLKLDDEVTISETAWRRGGAPSGGSAMYAPLNSRVRVEDLLRGSIIQSGNDACIALAEAVAADEAAFAALMTQHARELGLEKSYFGNATGLPEPASRVTARELAKLANHIIKTFPEYYGIYSEREFTWNKIRQQNRNPLLAMNIGADGMKTGFTKESGYGLVGSAVKDGLRLIVVVGGTKSAKERGEEARKLLENGFRAFESRLLFKQADAVGEARVFGGTKGSVRLVVDRDVRVTAMRNDAEKITARIIYSGPLQAPVEAGAQVGELKVWRGEHLMLTVPVKAAASVTEGTLSQRAFDGASELVSSLLRASAEKL